MTTAPAQLLGSIDDLLGAAASRYFGAGHKRVRHRLSAFEIRGLPGHGSVRAKATCIYPADWSRKASGSPPPHLSTIDAAAIAVQLTDVYLTATYGLSREQRRRSWLRSLEMRVAHAQENLAEFDVTATSLCVEPPSESRSGHRSTFLCQIGTVRVISVVEHQVASRQADASTSRDILGPARDRYYGEGYKHRTLRIEGVRLAEDLGSVHAAITVSADAESGQEDPGFGGAYQPSVSAIDSLLGLAQLAQVLAYRIDAISRAASHTLWMRRLAIQMDRRIAPLNTALAASVAVTSRGELELRGEPWRTLELTGRLMGVEVHAAVAHQLPVPPFRGPSAMFGPTRPTQQRRDR